MKTQPAIYLGHDGSDIPCEVTNIREEIPRRGKRRRKVGDLIVTDSTAGIAMWDCMPLDAEPLPEPVVGAFIVNAYNRCLTAQPLLDEGPFYMNHFATCPQGQSWSKGERT